MSDVESAMSFEENGGEDVPENLLTETAVLDNLKYGWFIKKFDTSKKASSAYDVIQKVHYRAVDGGEHVKHWYFCSRCETLIKHDAGIGTMPLIRHKEKTCPKLSAEEKARYAAKHTKAIRVVHGVEEKEEPSQTMKSQPATSSSSKNSHLFTDETIIDLIVKISRIGYTYGPINEVGLKPVLPKTGKEWLVNLINCQIYSIETKCLVTSVFKIQIMFLLIFLHFVSFQLKGMMQFLVR